MKYDKEIRGIKYLIDHIPKLFLDLLLCALKPLPQIIPHTAPLQQYLQRLLRIPNLHYPMDIFCRSP